MQTYMSKKKRIEHILSSSSSKVAIIRHLLRITEDGYDEKNFIQKEGVSGKLYWKLSDNLVNLLNNPPAVNFTVYNENLYIHAIYNYKYGNGKTSIVSINGGINNIYLLSGADNKIYVCPNFTIINDIPMLKVYD